MATETEIRLKPLSPESPAPDLPPLPSELGNYPPPLLVVPPVNPDATGVKRVLMILGIIAGFMTYVVPGFFGLRTYGYWRRGQAPTPYGWMAFGVAMTLLWVLVFILAMNSAPAPGT